MTATFESAMDGLRQTGASVDERELVEMLARHGQQEGVLLERYQRFVEEGPTPASRYLVQLILDDERKHHRLLAELANTIAWGLGANSPVEATPDIYPKSTPDPAFVEETQALIKAEEQDRSEVRRMRRKFKAYEDTTLWPLIIDILLLDTEKHLEILRFISKHVD